MSENSIKLALSLIDGVQEVHISGYTPMEWELTYDINQLKNLGTSAKLLKRNVKVPSKSIDEIKEEMQKIINNNEGIEPQAYSARIPTSGSPPSLKNERRYDAKIKEIRVIRNYGFVPVKG